MNKIIKSFLLLAAFIPFAMNKFAFFPYTTGESLFTRGFISIVSILFLIYFIYEKEFRNSVVSKIKIIIKNPLFISVLSFIFIFIISSIFAVNKYNAFWGTIERGEGLSGIIFFFAFFFYSLMIFEKKDWINFFKLNIIVSFIILIKEFVQAFSGITRPTSFLDNPTFLAGYLLSSILYSLIVISESKNSYWKYFSIVTLVMSICGIFIAETRGTILGLLVGTIAILIYIAIKWNNTSYKKINLRKFSIIILSSIIVFSAIFIGTRGSSVWQKVPGLSRIAVISNKDATTQTRLITTKISLAAINPSENGVKKFMLGWGPDNFNLAYGKYFDPEQFQYEMKWFDRSHDKLMDMLVMCGILGLLSYLSIYFFFFKSVFKLNISLTNLGLILFGSSIIIHLLFVFDQITTSIPFFAVMSFVISINVHNYYADKKNVNNIYNIITYIFLSIMAVILSFVFIRNDISSYFQMKEYFSFKNNINGGYILDDSNRIFEPFTPAQMNIRADFLDITTEKNSMFGNEFSSLAITKAEEYVAKNPQDVRFLVYLASAYSSKGEEAKDISLIKKGEDLFNKAVLFAPNRPDMAYGLAVNLLYQNNIKEAFTSFERAFDLSPKYFSLQSKENEGVYLSFLGYFYKDKDMESFIKVANRLRENNYEGSSILTKILEYIKKTNTWPPIKFE